MPALWPCHLEGASSAPCLPSPAGGVGCAHVCPGDPALRRAEPEVLRAPGRPGGYGRPAFDTAHGQGTEAPGRLRARTAAATGPHRQCRAGFRPASSSTLGPPLLGRLSARHRDRPGAVRDPDATGQRPHGRGQAPDGYHFFGPGPRLQLERSGRSARPRNGPRPFRALLLPDCSAIPIHDRHELGQRGGRPGRPPPKGHLPRAARMGPGGRAVLGPGQRPRRRRPAHNLPDVDAHRRRCPRGDEPGCVPGPGGSLCRRRRRFRPMVACLGGGQPQAPVRGQEGTGAHRLGGRRQLWPGAQRRLHPPGPGATGDGRDAAGHRSLPRALLPDSGRRLGRRGPGPAPVGGLAQAAPRRSAGGRRRRGARRGGLPRA